MHPGLRLLPQVGSVQATNTVPRLEEQAHTPVLTLTLPARNRIDHARYYALSPAVEKLPLRHPLRGPADCPALACTVCLYRRVLG